MVKKKLLSVALVAVTVCSMIFTGCGSSAENTGNDTGKTDSDAQAGNTAGDVADVAEESNWKSSNRITMPTMMCWDRPLPADRRTGQMSLSLDLPIIPDMRERELSGI